MSINFSTTSLRYGTILVVQASISGFDFEEAYQIWFIDIIEVPNTGKQVRWFHYTVVTRKRPSQRHHSSHGLEFLVKRNSSAGLAKAVHVPGTGDSFRLHNCRSTYSCTKLSIDPLALRYVQLVEQELYNYRY